MDHVFYDIQVDSVPPELKPPASIEKLLEVSPAHPLTHSLTHSPTHLSFFFVNHLITHPLSHFLQFKVQGQKFSKKGNENDIIERYTRLTRESTFTKLDRTSYLEIFGKPTQSDSNSLDGSNHIPTITSISDQKVNEEEELAYTSPPVVRVTFTHIDSCIVAMFRICICSISIPPSLSIPVLTQHFC
jgi:hypothetical protein